VCHTLSVAHVRFGGYDLNKSFLTWYLNIPTIISIVSSK
jgi:hypothetical protein